MPGPWSPCCLISIGQTEGMPDVAKRPAINAHFRARLLTNDLLESFEVYKEDQIKKRYGSSASFKIARDVFTAVLHEIEKRGLGTLEALEKHHIAEYAKEKLPDKPPTHPVSRRTYDPAPPMPSSKWPWPGVQPSELQNPTTPSLAEDARWIYNHLLFDPKDIDPKSAPSPGALHWYLEIKRSKSKTKFKEFYGMLPKCLGIKAHGEVDTKLNENRAYRFIDKLRKARAEAVAEAKGGGDVGLQPQPILSPGPEGFSRERDLSGKGVADGG